MANIVIVSQRLLGHIVPAIGIGVQLKKSGHNVTIYSHRSLKPLIDRLGLRYEELGWDKYPDTFIEEMLDDLYTKLKDKPVDLIINDSSLCAPSYIAEMLDIPWISFQTTVPVHEKDVPGKPAVNRKVRELLLKDLNRIRLKYKLSPLMDFNRTRGDYFGLSPYLHLVLVYPELIMDPSALPPSCQVVGDCSFEEANAALEKRIGEAATYPTITVCTSSVPRFEFQELTKSLIENSLDVFDKEPYSLFLSLNSEIKFNYKMTKHTHIIREFPNHNILFKFSNLVITHGGCGTLQKSMKYGVPMIVLPMGADHEYLGSIVENLGVGRMMLPEKITRLNEYRDAILNNDDFKRRANNLSVIINKYKPTETAEKFINKILSL